MKKIISSITLAIIYSFLITGQAVASDYVYDPKSGEFINKVGHKTFYSIINNKVYVQNYKEYKKDILEGADASTFVQLDDPIVGKDKNHIYKNGEIQKQLDISTFEILGKYPSFISKDKNNVYFSYQPTTFDPGSFKFLSHMSYENSLNNPLQFFKDKNGVYFSGSGITKIFNADPNSFEGLNNYYGKDKNSVFYCFYSSCSIVKEIDSATTIRIDNDIIKDKNASHKGSTIGSKNISNSTTDTLIKAKEFGFKFYKMTNDGQALKLSANINKGELAKKLSGRILLQVESRGEAWYVDTVSGGRYYMPNGESAYQMMRKLGLGIKTSDLKNIPIGVLSKSQEIGIDSDSDGLDDNLEDVIGTDPKKSDSDSDGYNDKVEVSSGYNPLGNSKTTVDNKLTERLKGKILLQVESRGEAWYLNPEDNKRYYLANGNTAYQIMRLLSLGAINEVLNSIPETSLE